MANKPIIQILVKNNLKVTPQRIAILEVILTLNNHPDVELITDYLRISHPDISIATIYRTLETFTKKGIIRKVISSNDPMRYDGIQKRHHHLYSAESDRIEDYYDDELFRVIDNYLKKKPVPDFTIEDIKVQITGKSSQKQEDK